MRFARRMFEVLNYIFNPEQFYKRESNCTCAVPCERVVYEPKLSYAQLSHLNVQRFVAGSNNQQREIETEVYAQQDELNVTASQDQLMVIESTNSTNSVLTTKIKWFGIDVL